MISDYEHRRKYIYVTRKSIFEKSNCYTFASFTCTKKFILSFFYFYTLILLITFDIALVSRKNPYLLTDFYMREDRADGIYSINPFAYS